MKINDFSKKKNANVKAILQIRPNFLNYPEFPAFRYSPPRSLFQDQTIQALKASTSSGHLARATDC